jgi:hypothetical protein
MPGVRRPETGELQRLLYHSNNYFPLPEGFHQMYQDQLNDKLAKESSSYYTHYKPHSPSENQIQKYVDAVLKRREHGVGHRNDFLTSLCYYLKKNNMNVEYGLRYANKYVNLDDKEFESIVRRLGK